MELPLPDEGVHTGGDYRRWDHDVRYELIDGMAYAMPPSPTRPQQEGTGRIYRQAANAMAGAKCRVLIVPLDVHLPP